jgi:hypothetical protein
MRQDQFREAKHCGKRIAEPVRDFGHETIHTGKTLQLEDLLIQPYLLAQIFQDTDAPSEVRKPDIL